MQLQTWYALGVLILILRHVVRLRTVGLQGYQGDDYLSILVCHFIVAPGREMRGFIITDAFSHNRYSLCVCTRSIPPWATSPTTPEETST